MNKYSEFQSILNAALGSYQTRGFRLVEKGDHALLLYHEDEQVAIFSQVGAIIPLIHEACRDHLCKAHSGDLIKHIDECRGRAGL